MIIYYRCHICYWIIVDEGNAQLMFKITEIIVRLARLFFLKQSLLAKAANTIYYLTHQIIYGQKIRVLFYLKGKKTFRFFFKQAQCFYVSNDTNIFRFLFVRIYRQNNITFYLHRMSQPCASDTCKRTSRALCHCC